MHPTNLCSTKLISVRNNYQIAIIDVLLHTWLFVMRITQSVRDEFLPYNLFSGLSLDTMVVWITMVV